MTNHLCHHRPRNINTYPLHAGLVHALRVLLQLEVLTVGPGAQRDVCREVRHVGHPGHRPLVGRGGRVEAGGSLGTLNTLTKKIRGQLDRGKSLGRLREGGGGFIH